MKILSVDDSAVVRKIIRAASEVLQFEMEEAQNGLEALKVLENLNGHVDLILLDWNMPGMNGFELLVHLKSTEHYKRIPVMMVTTESQKENIVTAIQAGAIHYLIKPFTMEELMKRIMEGLGRGDL